MKKADALAKLRQQIDEIANLKDKETLSGEWTKWRRDTEVAIEKIFGKDTRHSSEFSNIKYSLNYFGLRVDEAVTRRTFLSGLDLAESILESMHKEVNDYHLDDSNHPEKKDTFETLTHICQCFPAVVKRLRSRHADRPTITISDEYDVQDLFSSLLVLFFDDIRGEEWTPSYAGSSSRMDFLLWEEETVIEIKMTRKGLGDKQVGDQLFIDIKKYQSHPSCKNLFCFVYDPVGKITNPKGLENDLNKLHDSLSVRVCIVN